MLESTKAQLRISELREAINSPDTDKSELERLRAESLDTERRYREAIEAEAKAEAESVSEDTPEGRDLGRLRERSSIVEYLREAVEGVPVQGAAKELRQAIGDEGMGTLPLDLLAPARHRVDSPTTIGNTDAAVGARQMGIFPRIFANSASSFLGVQMPSVGPGDVLYPRLSSGTTADIRLDGVELDGTAAALTTVRLEPVRLTASYLYDTRSALLVDGLEETLRMDLQAVLADKLDDLILNGQSAVSNVSPAVAGITNTVAAPSAQAAGDAAVAAIRVGVARAVDGRYAGTYDQVRVLMGTQTFRALSNQQDAVGNYLPIADQILGGAEYMVSAQLPNAPSSGSLNDNQTNVVYSAGSPARGVYAPVWRAADLIVDPYSNAKAGRVQVTIAMFVAVQIVDPEPYRLVAVRIS